MPVQTVTRPQENSFQAPDMGAAASHEAVTQALGLPEHAGSAAIDSQMAEGVARMNAVANGEHVAEDDTRMYDVQAAEKAAYAEHTERQEANFVKDVEQAREMAMKEEVTSRPQADWPIRGNS